VREVIASLGLIPVGLEGGTNQVHLIAGLALDKISDRDISSIDEVLLWEQFLLSQVGMDRREGSLIAQGSKSRLDVGDQLWSIFITGLAKMDGCHRPKGWSSSSHSARQGHRGS
jgi:hypothetical protein